jgi:hypothetical protein
VGGEFSRDFEGVIVAYLIAKLSYYLSLLSSIPCVNLHKNASIVLDTSYRELRRLFTMSEVRQRNARSKGGEKDTSSGPSAASLAKEEDRSRITVLEVLRTITLIILLSGLVSWFVTRDNVLWGVKRPRATHLSYWKAMLVSTAAPLVTALILRPFSRPHKSPLQTTSSKHMMAAIPLSLFT